MRWCWVALALLLALDARGQVAGPIVQPGHPWAFDGFSITPPKGDWASLSKTRSRAVFVMRSRAPGSTIVAAVVATPHEAFASREAFLAYMRSQRGTHIDMKRYELSRHEEGLESGDIWCTRYNLLGSDRPSFFAATWFIEVFGRSCWHAQAQLIIDLNISERSLAGEEDDAALASGETLLGSLVLHPVETLDLDAGNLRMQAERGSARAALRLAAMYEEGRGVPVNPAQAENLYRQAAEAGEVDAQYNLGLLYLRKALGPADAEQGIYWLMRAADQRDAQAQYNLGLIFYQGKWVEPDFGQAYDWFRLAAANGHDKAGELLRPGPSERSNPPAQ